MEVRRGEHTTDSGTAESGMIRRRLAHLRQSLLWSRLKSIAHLFAGNWSNTLLMLVGTTIAARALGAEIYGVFALVLTVGRLCERLVRFESWQPLIRFAANEELDFNNERMASLFLYGLLLDIGSALLAALLTLCAGYLLLPVIDLRPEDMPLVAIYAVAIALNIRGFPTAALRLNGQFKMLAYLQMFSSIVRVLLAFLALELGMGIMAFVLIWTFAQALDAILFLAVSFRSLRQQGVSNPLTAEWRGLTEKFPGFMRFAWSSNLSSTLRTLTQEADTLLVGALAGASSAGFYHISKRIAKVAMQVGAIIQAVIYPDMARMWAKLEISAFRAMTSRLQLALAGAGIAILGVTLLIGKPAIEFAFGSKFLDVYPLLVAQLIAVILILHAAPSRSALLAMNRSGLVLGVAICSTAVFFAVAFFTIPSYGAMGANIAHIAFGCLTVVAMDLAWWRGSRQADSGA